MCVPRQESQRQRDVYRVILAGKFRKGAEHTRLSADDCLELTFQRRQLGIDAAAHADCLRELGWTERDYELGHLEKTTNAALVRQLQQQADLLVTQQLADLSMSCRAWDV